MFNRSLRILMVTLIVTCLTFVGNYPAFASSDSQCSQLFAGIQVRPQRVGQADIEVRETYDGRVLDVSKMLDEKGVFLGVSKSGHFYLLVGRTRYEGAYFPIPVFAISGRNSDGYLVHFPNVPKEKIDHWLNSMKKGIRGFSLSCVAAACSALRSGFDIKLGGSSIPSIFSSDGYNRILKNGFVDENGNPVEFHIYRTSERVPKMENLKLQLASQDVFLGATSLFFMAMTGMGAYFLVNVLF